MIISAILSQMTPLAIGYLTDDVLTTANIHFISTLPILIFILGVTIFNEAIKVIRRLIVEDTSTSVEKMARVKAIRSLLMAPLSYFRLNMRGNIHGRLNRSLEGTTNMLKLIFMDFAPSIFTSIAAITVIFIKLPFLLALIMMLVIPIGIGIVLRQISTQRGIRVDLLETKSAMDGTMVETPYFFAKNSLPPLPDNYSSTIFFLNSNEYFAIRKPTSQSLVFWSNFWGRFTMALVFQETFKYQENIPPLIQCIYFYRLPFTWSLHSDLLFFYFAIQGVYTFPSNISAILSQACPSP